MFSVGTLLHTMMKTIVIEGKEEQSFTPPPLRLLLPPPPPLLLPWPGQTPGWQFGLSRADHSQ